MEAIVIVDGQLPPPVVPGNVFRVSHRERFTAGKLYEEGPEWARP
jgi:hypothetical protein